jgi:hypothetical protein
VVEAATGKLRAIATGEGVFAPVWLDDTRLAYVDKSTGEPSVRLIDVTTGDEQAHIATPGGVGTDWLPAGAPCAAGLAREMEAHSPEEEIFFEEEEDSEDAELDAVADPDDPSSEKRP